MSRGLLLVLDHPAHLGSLPSPPPCKYSGALIALLRFLTGKFFCFESVFKSITSKHFGNSGTVLLLTCCRVIVSLKSCPAVGVGKFLFHCGLCEPEVNSLLSSGVRQTGGAGV